MVLAAPPRRAGPAKRAGSTTTSFGGKFETVAEENVSSSGKSRIYDGRAVGGSSSSKPLKLKIVGRAYDVTAEREVANLGRIRKANGGATKRSFVELVDVIRDDRGQSVLVLEAGVIDLQRYVEANGAVQGKNLRAWAREAAQILKAVHKAGLVWTDASLKNLVLMAAGGAIKAIDLESAVAAGSSPVDLFPAVTPPEAAAALRRGVGAVKVDAAFDAWALGMGILHLYLGEEYFAANGVRGTNNILAELSRDGFAVDLSAVKDAQLKRLLAELLNSDPRRRVAALRGPNWYLSGPMLPL